ncbi:hypothetical protein SCALIN_C01_0139 [Candidatus Scalindua japonica]|uniref:Uncharacterized protein n=1 Tax=Candidatus Scalindua japonica TaxID=1284222 RepID=A0A286TTL1_9BACT|nr:hypothetical protein SCALIN_C01_0139 [Candidatus Scalindua japonica]
METIVYDYYKITIYFQKGKTAICNLELDIWRLQIYAISNARSALTVKCHEKDVL